MFEVIDHRLIAAPGNATPVQFEASPNVNASTIAAQFLVFHYTACSFAAARAVFMRGTGDGRVSAHLLIDTNGSVTQFVPFNKRAWHAGESFWAGMTDLNTHSIGIEVVNLGYLLKHGDGRFGSADGSSTVSADQVVEARHKNPHEHHRYWQAYTPAQIETCTQLAVVLRAAYNLVDVVGHDDIAPARKSDPGPAFPLRHMVASAFGRADDETSTQWLFVGAAKLNIRQGPGTQFPLVAAALPVNTAVRPLQPSQGGWMQVEAQATPPVVGWVSAAYLRATVM